MSDIKATRAGQEQEVAVKRPTELRPFNIDCSALLRQYELIVRVTNVAVNGLTPGDARTRNGTDLEVVLGGGSVPSNAQYRDYTVTAFADTTQGSLSVVFVVRVFK